MRQLMLILLLIQTHVTVASDWQQAFSGSRLVIGITAKSTDLEVQNPDNPFDAYGLLTQPGFTFTPLLSFYTPDIYFNDHSRWGWFIDLGWKNFTLSRQEKPNGLSADLPLDLGTSVTGNFYHLTPVLFYSWGDRHIGKQGGQSFKFGVGYGVGYMQATGNIIFTETTQENHAINISGTGLAVSVLMDYRYNNWYMRALGSGPGITRRGYEYAIFDFSMDMGYIHTF